MVYAYFATGGSDWYRDTARATALVSGWEQACTIAGCTWGGGESPSQSGLLTHDEIELAGTAIGAIPNTIPAPIFGQLLAPGNEIVIVASSGLHANGASLARRIATTVPEGLQAQLASGATFGQALLAPAHICAACRTQLGCRHRHYVPKPHYRPRIPQDHESTADSDLPAHEGPAGPRGTAVHGRRDRHGYARGIPNLQYGCRVRSVLPPGIGQPRRFQSLKISRCTRKSSDMWRLALGR